MTDRETAWFAVPDAVEHLPGWRVTKAEFHEDERRWRVTARDDAPRRRPGPAGDTSHLVPDGRAVRP